MDDLRAEYEFTYPMFVEANRLHRTKLLRATLFFWIVFVVFPLVTAVLAALALIAERKGEPSASLWSTCFAFAFYSALLWVFRAVSFRKTYKNGFPKSLSSRTMDLVISERGVFARTSGEVETNFTWASLCRVVHNDSLALLYYSKTRFLPVPRKSFTSGSWEAFLELATKKLGAGKC